jgi:micrococcal nuclease
MARPRAAICLLAALCAVCLHPAVAAGGACPVLGTKPVSIANVAPGGLVTGEGSEIRLSGLLAADTGAEALAWIRSAGPLRLADLGAPDRYGRVPGQLFAGDKWVQGELLRQGLARVWIEPRDTSCALPLYSAEEEGRMSRAGHWGDGRFAVLSADGLQGRNGTFQIVEAKAQNAAIIRGRAFINFGPDYRTDFTVTVAPSDMREFRRAKFDIRALAGKRVRVRGFVDFYNGPEMEVALPEAIEVLD